MILLKLVAFFTMNESQLPQNRCVPLCDLKGSTAPNGEKFEPKNILGRNSCTQYEESRDFSVTDFTKVCLLYFKDEHLKKSFGIRGLMYVEGAVPFVLSWKRSSPRKWPGPKPGLVTLQVRRRL